MTLSVGIGNIERKSGERLGYRERSALNALQSRSFLRTKEDSFVHDIRPWTLNNDENLVLSRPPLSRFYNALKRGGYAYVASEWPSQPST